MTAPEQRAGGLDANARGIAVLVVAAAIGLLLLWKAGGTDDATAVTTDARSTTTVDTSDVTGDSGVDSTTATTAGGEPGSSTTAAAGTNGTAPGEVNVIVLNGSGKTGVAKTNTVAIAAAGYMVGTPGNANARIDTTAVYFAEGFEAEATAVASVLGKPADVVTALPDPPPGPGADASDVVVVLGMETAPVGGGNDASTTTTAAG